MSHERRYRDREIRQILDLAIREDEPVASLPPGDGLTLRELQEVGREIGVPADRVAQAVAEFEGRGEAAPRGRFMGLPFSVGRIAPLARAPSDREWEMLVAELRATFGGKGEMTSHGGLREWSTETLHAFIEPTEDGHRIRLTDSATAASIGLTVGGFLLALALMIGGVLLGKEDAGFKFVVPIVFSLIGGGLVGGTVLNLPRWAREQERRMEHVVRRAASLTALPAPEEPPSPTSD